MEKNRVVNRGSLGAITLLITVGMFLMIGPGSQISAGDALSDDGVYVWQFEEGSGQFAYDNGDLKNNLTLGSNIEQDDSDPLWVNGVIGSSLYFDGVDDYAVSKDEIDIAGNKNRSISFWVKPDIDEIEGNSAIITWGDALQQRELCGLKYSLPQKKFLFHGAYQDITTSNTYNQDIWHDVVFTYDGSDGKLYINGELDISSPLELETESTKLSVGFNILEIEGGWNRHFKGSIDEVRIYDRVLSRSEISIYYNETKNHAPVITSIDGPDTVEVNETFILTADATDMDGDILTYQWKCKENITLIFNGKQMEFSIDTAGMYNFTLSVSDGIEVVTDTVSVIVIDSLPPPENHAPVITSIDGPVTVEVNGNFILNADATDMDGDFLTFQWTCYKNITWILYGKQIEFSIDTVGMYNFTVSVCDGIEVVTDTVSVIVIDSSPPPENHAPVITFIDGPDTVEVNESINLTAKATDIDGDFLTYQWTCKENITWILNGSQIELSIDTAGMYNFTVSVSDNIEVVTGTVSVKVEDGSNGPSDDDDDKEPISNTFLLIIGGGCGVLSILIIIGVVLLVIMMVKKGKKRSSEELKNKDEVPQSDGTEMEIGKDENRAEDDNKDEDKEKNEDKIEDKNLEKDLNPESLEENPIQN